MMLEFIRVLGLQLGISILLLYFRDIIQAIVFKIMPDEMKSHKEEL